MIKGVNKEFVEKLMNILTVSKFEKTKVLVCVQSMDFKSSMCVNDVIRA
jgi:hypothetical protein